MWRSICDVACFVSDVLLKLFRHFLLPRAKQNATSLCRRPRKKKSSWRQFGISDALQKLWEKEGEEIELQVQQKKQTISESLAVFAEVLRRFPCFLHFVQWFFRIWHYMWKMPSSFFELVVLKFFQATKAEKTNELTTKKIDLKDAEKAIGRKALRNCLKVTVWNFGMVNIFWIFTWLSQTLVTCFSWGKTIMQALKAAKEYFEEAGFKLHLALKRLRMITMTHTIQYFWRNSSSEKGWNGWIRFWYGKMLHVLLHPAMSWRTWPMRIGKSGAEAWMLKTSDDTRRKDGEAKAGQAGTTNDNHRFFTKTSQVPAVSEVFPCFFVVVFFKGFPRYEVKLGNEARVFLHLKRERRCQEIESLKDVLEVLQGTSWEWEAESPWFTASDRRKRWQAWCKVQWLVYYGLLLSIPESNIESAISVWEGSRVGSCRCSAQI